MPKTIILGRIEMTATPGGVAEFSGISAKTGRKIKLSTVFITGSTDTFTSIAKEAVTSAEDIRAEQARRAAGPRDETDPYQALSDFFAAAATAKPPVGDVRPSPWNYGDNKGAGG